MVPSKWLAASTSEAIPVKGVALGAEDLKLAETEMAWPKVRVVAAGSPLTDVTPSVMVWDIRRGVDRARAESAICSE